MSRRGTGGAGWAKRHRANIRHMNALRETDERDVGGLRVDLEALLAAPVEGYPVSVEDFRERAHRWLTRAS